MDINLGTLLGVLIWLLIVTAFWRIFSAAVAATVKEDKEAHDNMLKRFAYNTKKPPA